MRLKLVNKDIAKLYKKYTISESVDYAPQIYIVVSIFIKYLHLNWLHQIEIRIGDILWYWVYVHHNIARATFLYTSQNMSEDGFH